MNADHANTTATGRKPPGAGSLVLESGSVVGVIGGGPAGSFFAIHLLREATRLGRQIRVMIFEARHQSPQGEASDPGCWKGCNHCAGGISPRLNDILAELDLDLPDEVIQNRIRTVTIQGYWKNISLEVPAGRRMFSVYRGSRPSRRRDRQHNLDGFLLKAAKAQGAELIDSDVTDVRRLEQGKIEITCRPASGENRIEADFVVFAAGVNAKPGLRAEENPMFQMVRRLIPGYEPPRMRRALIFEMELEAGKPVWLDEEVYFVEYGSRSLPLEMCSLVPKRGFLTAVLVGRSVDSAPDPASLRSIMHGFLELPQIRKLVPPRTQLRLACTCSPNMVVGTARNPFASRVAVIGDMVTARLYKDGILSAHQTARHLAGTVLEQGIDEESLQRGYGPAVRRFCRDNRFAAVVFLLHRIVFSSSLLSRVLYQAVLTERKSRPAAKRTLEAILWKIASGDDRYEQVFWSMLRPSVLRSITIGGAGVTLRNFLAEQLFGLRWLRLGRFTTGVALERLESKRASFAHRMVEYNLPVPGTFEFERMYTIRIRAPHARVFEQLGRFGESDRGYLHPRWVGIRRIAGMPNQMGCTVEYTIGTRPLCFRLCLEHVVSERLIVYRVQNGFARGGVLIFELEPPRPDTCDLSIYVAFHFRRGQRWFTRPGWWLGRHLFPAFIHDVIWNHSLCQLKDLVEEQHQAGEILLQDATSLSSAVAPAASNSTRLGN